MSKRIVLSSDHADIKLRMDLAAYIAGKGFDVTDIGPTTDASTDYPKHGAEAAQMIADGKADLGILICGTGQGIMMAANKVVGIRCGVCSDVFSAKMIREHNNAQMMAMGARVIGTGLAIEIVDAFLSAEFEGGRHAKRVEMIEG